MSIVEVIIPQVGEAVSELTIIDWLKKEGDPVKKGEALFEVDTEKMTLEIEAFADGVLSKILVPAGVEVEVYQVVGHIEVEP
jgi:pyruvate/2-oxoglutarate dehydrogenase complex dihydrolipoamide acyltransferase (E2) component